MKTLFNLLVLMSFAHQAFAGGTPNHPNPVSTFLDCTTKDKTIRFLVQTSASFGDSFNTVVSIDNQMVEAIASRGINTARGIEISPLGAGTNPALDVDFRIYSRTKSGSFTILSRDTGELIEMQLICR